MIAVGAVLADKYRVDKVLGIGGMGMVVAATHLELDQRVALKFMLPEALMSAQATDRFLREARAAVKLRGEHVCRVLDVGKLENGSPYIVMEFLEGEDFAQLLSRRGALPVHEAIDFVLQALEGLAEAHVNGIVHRDLKPGNLFIATDNDGSPLVKVLDFGISKLAGANATKTGEVMGSPAYMAPEQMVSAKDVDARADLWAMGVILYHAIAGRIPFEEDNLPALCMAVMNSTPRPVDAIAPNPVPPGLSATVMRCLAKQREGRPSDVGELAAALAPFGSADAQASAARIGKVLRRQGSSSGSSAAIAVTMPSSSSLLPAAQATPTTPNQPISTIGASAGESLRLPPQSPAKPKSKWPLFAAGGASAAIAVVVIALAARGGKSDPTTPSIPTPTTQPPPSEPSKPLIEQTTVTPPVQPTTTAVTPPVQPPTTPTLESPVKPTKPTIATKPSKPVTLTTTTIKAGSGSGSSTTVAETPKPGSGSASTKPATSGAGSGPGSGYKGIEGKIITEYPPPKAP